MALGPTSQSKLFCTFPPLHLFSLRLQSNSFFYCQKHLVQPGMRHSIWVLLKELFPQTFTALNGSFLQPYSWVDSHIEISQYAPDKISHILNSQGQGWEQVRIPAWNGSFLDINKPASWPSGKDARSNFSMRTWLDLMELWIGWAFLLATTTISTLS